MGLARLIGLSGVLLLTFALSPTALVPIGAQAPDFTLPNIDGGTLTLSHCRGKIVLLDFFATWCGPCKAAMPHLKELQTEFPTQLMVISISTSPGTDTVDALKQFRDQYEMTWTVLRDNASVSSDLYGVTAIPTLYILNMEGVVQFSHVGEPPGGVSTLRGEIQTLIPASKRTTQITLSISASSVEAGKAVSLSGALNPPLRIREILIMITCPNGSVKTISTWTTTEGAYSLGFIPDTAGAWTFRAQFAGDIGYLPCQSTDATLDAVAPKVPTQLTLSLSSPSIIIGYQAGASGVLSPGISGKTISILITCPNGSTVTRTATTSSGGTFSFSFVPDVTGLWKLKAQFAGDAQYLASETTQSSLTVSPKIGTTLAISLSATSTEVGTQISISGTMSPALSGKAIVILVVGPSGSTSSLSAVTGAEGAFSTTFTPDAEGTWTFTASFAGDAQYHASASSGVALTVKQPFPTLLVAAGGGLIVVIAIVGYLVLLRKPSQLPPPPPPPPPPQVGQTPRPPIQIPPPPAAISDRLRQLLPYGLSAVFVASILIGLGPQYEIVQAFVRFLCQSCVGLG